MERMSHDVSFLSMELLDLASTSYEARLEFMSNVISLLTIRHGDDIMEDTREDYYE